MNYYLVQVYFALNIFFVGRYWEEFVVYKPTFFERVKLLFLIVVGLFTAVVFMILMKSWDILHKIPIWFRKTHIQIGTTAYVWGDGLSSPKSHEIIPLSNCSKDQRFVVKYYKYISIVSHA
jgi:hypothetical protein